MSACAAPSLVGQHFFGRKAVTLSCSTLRVGAQHEKLAVSYLGSPPMAAEGYRDRLHKVGG
jgi:hypothetical protein